MKTDHKTTRRLSWSRSLSDVGPTPGRAWILVLVIAGCIQCFGGKIAAAQESRNEKYRKLLARFEATPSNQHLQAEGHVLIVTSLFTYGDRAQEPFRGPWRWGREISVKGRVWSFSHTAFSSKGGGYGQVSKDDLERVKERVKNLPGSVKTLPVDDRVVILQVPKDDGFLVRVYDRADMPDAVLELLRLAKAPVSPWMPVFRPDEEIQPHDHDDGALHLLPGGRFVSASRYDELKVFDTLSLELLDRSGATKKIAVHDMTISPDGGLAVIRGASDHFVLDTKNWQWVTTIATPKTGERTYGHGAARFTNDGRWLQISASEGPLRFFNTKSWNEVDRDSVSDVPTQFLDVVTSPSGRSSVVVPERETVALYHTAAGEVEELLKQSRLVHVAYSPDESRVAVSIVQQGNSEYWTRHRLFLWKTENGELIHEMGPLEQKGCEKIESLFWSPDGRYVLAAAKPSSGPTSRTVCVWNAATGRHRGDFQGPPTATTGVGLDRGRLIVGCRDGKVRVWDFQKAMQSIRTFEQSLQKTE